MLQRYKRRIVIILLLAVSHAWPTIAIAEATPDELQEKFNRNYQPYLGVDSQTPLPFTTIEAQDWRRIQESRTLLKIYSEPGKYYNQKVYTFTLYRARDTGEYYLNAKGGFWGMEELTYGPFTEKAFE